MNTHRILGSILLTTVVLCASAASADPTLGFREEFPAGNGIGSWSGGATLSNPGTGGLGGLNDGYLLIARSILDRLGANSTEPAYSGNWSAAGVTQLRMWLTDPGTDDSLEIHASVGNATNLWQYNPGFFPPRGRWAEYVVDLTNAAAFTHIIGGGTFAQALQTADRILIRHDRAPYTMSPDLIIGDFGVDHILLTNGTVGVDPLASASGRSIALGPVFPNPSRGPVTLSVVARAAERVRLEVVDVHGRRIRCIDLPAGASARRWTWDGRDERGARVPPGAYRVRALGASGGMSQPLIRID